MSLVPNSCKYCISLVTIIFFPPITLYKNCDICIWLLSYTNIIIFVEDNTLIYDRLCHRKEWKQKSFLISLIRNHKQPTRRIFRRMVWDSGLSKYSGVTWGWINLINNNENSRPSRRQECSAWFHIRFLSVPKSNHSIFQQITDDVKMKYSWN